VVRRWSPALLWGASTLFSAGQARAEESRTLYAQNDALTAGPPNHAVPAPIAPPRDAPETREVGEGAGLRSVLLGTAIALIPSTIGGAIVARGPTQGTKNVGFVFAGTGFIVAPMFAHGINGEWGRGALFCIPSLASEIGMTSIVSLKPDAVFDGTTLSRTTFVGLFTVDIFTSALGIVDAALIQDRRRGHGIFTRRNNTHFALTQIVPGAGQTPYGATFSLSL
jgi:hypothetical protein